MKFKKLLKVTVILILINICTTLSLESVSLQSKTITTNEEKPKTSVTTENFHRKQRQSRCIRCYEDGQSPGQSPESDSRYGNRYLDDGRRYSRDRYYSSSYPSRRTNYDDSNWYNAYDRYDRIDDKTRYSENRYPDRYFNRLLERDRYPADRYVDRYPPSGIRNEERYHSRTYDHYDNRPPIYNNRYDSRISYDHGQEYRGRYNDRERPYDRTRSGSYYNDRNYEYDHYDRNNFRDYDYDYRNRPVDDTNRDQDYQPGRGYANSDLPQRPYNNYPNNFPYTPSRHAYLPNPQSPPRPLQSQNSSTNSNHDSSPDYQNSRPPSDKSYAGDWSYANDRNKPGYNTDKDKDINSYPYGGRSRPITGSYLLDRNSNVPMDLQNKDSINSTEEKTVNTTSNQNNNDKKNDVKSNQ